MNVEKYMLLGTIYRFLEKLGIIKIMLLSILIYGISNVLLIGSLFVLEETYLGDLMMRILKLNIFDFVGFLTISIFVIKIFVQKIIKYYYMKNELVDIKEYFSEKILKSIKINQQEDVIEVKNFIKKLLERYMSIVIKRVISNKINKLNVDFLPLESIDVSFDMNYFVYRESFSLTTSDIILYGDHINEGLELIEGSIRGALNIESVRDLINSENFDNDSVEGDNPEKVENCFTNDISGENESNSIIDKETIKEKEYNFELFLKTLKKLKVIKFISYINAISLLVALITAYLSFNRIIINDYFETIIICMINIGIMVVLPFFVQSLYKDFYSKLNKFVSFERCELPNFLEKVDGFKGAKKYFKYMEIFFLLELWNIIGDYEKMTNEEKIKTAEIFEEIFEIVDLVENDFEVNSLIVYSKKLSSEIKNIIMI